MVTLWPAATCDLRHRRRSASSGPCQKVTISGRKVLRSSPGARGLRLGLVGIDRGLLLQGEADIVQPVHQAVLAERIDLEFHRAAVRPTDFLVGKIDGQRRT